jgi:hypothetical protein
MSGLEDILGGLMGGQGGSGGLDSILGGLTGGGGQGGSSGRGALVPVLGGLLASGGLQKILGGLKANGLSQQADSWVGTGANQPVSGPTWRRRSARSRCRRSRSSSGSPSPRPPTWSRRPFPRWSTRSRPEGKLPPEQDLDAAFDKLAKAGAA